VLDFGVLPPEINSARMYSGPGSGPMLAAAEAWDVLAEQLSSAAVGCESVIAELSSGQWLGSSSAAMVDAAAPYVAWLHTAAMQAERSAAQAKEAAAAYELAFVTTVPPAVIAENRSLLMTLIATNFFGQNTPTIAATETHYAEMWAQDAVTMYGYAGSSSAATTLTPFSPPPSTTDPAGLAAQSGAVAHAASSSSGSSPTTLSQLISELPAALHQLAAPTTPAASSDSLITFNPLFDLIGLGLTPPRLANVGLAYSSAATSDRGILIINDRLAFQAEQDLQKGLKFTANVAPARPGGPLVSAGWGQASPVGSLSVPPNWANAAPAIRPVALALPDAGPTGAAESSANLAPVPGSSFSQAVLGTLSREVAPPRQPKTRPIIVRSPAAG
jgi:PPE-repeat protein